MRRLIANLAALLWGVAVAQAQPVGLTDNVLRKEINLGGQMVVIERNQDTTATIPQDFARTSRACPPFCITPMAAAPGVPTLGELELIAFLEDKVAKGQGVLMDSRLPEFYLKGAVPGAVNVPWAG